MGGDAAPAATSKHQQKPGGLYHTIPVHTVLSEAAGLQHTHHISSAEQRSMVAPIHQPLSLPPQIMDGPSLPLYMYRMFPQVYPLSTVYQRRQPCLNSKHPPVTFCHTTSHTGLLKQCACCNGGACTRGPCCCPVDLLLRTTPHQ